MTVIPEGVAPADGRLVTRPLADLTLRREVGLAYRQADAGSPRVARILDALTRGAPARTLVGPRAA